MRKKDERRKEIYAAITTKDEKTVARICKDLKITRPTFYLYTREFPELQVAFTDRRVRLLQNQVRIG